MQENASTASPFTSMSSLTMSDSGSRRIRNPSSHSRGDALDPVMEVNQDFVQRHQAGQHHAARIQRLRVVHRAALFGNQDIMSPIYSFGQMTKALTIGSAMP